MEKRLKRERNRLFLRVILILLAVWLTVSAVFCAVRLSVETVNVQQQELANLSHATQLLTVGNGSAESFSRVFVDYSDFVYDPKNPDPKFDSQMIFTNRTTGKVIADTKNSIAAEYYLRNPEADQTACFVMLLNYDTVRNALTDEQYSEIGRYLNTERDDGCYYELICTKMHFSIYFIPLELKLVLVNGDDPRFLVDSNVATYDLSVNRIEGNEAYDSREVRRNVIPKEFLLDGAYNKDIIGTLSKQERKTAAGMLHRDGLNYVFYASVYLSFDGDETEPNDEGWLMQYAKEVNLFDNCKRDLALGVAAVFFFFLTIAVILCIMIWRTVKSQLIQEQKRLDLTNALAHDIKTPLFVISGYAYSLKEDIDADEREQYLDKIIEQTDEVNHLVHRMLSFSKLDSYKMTLHKTDLDLGALTEELLQNYAALPDGKRMTFERSGANTVSADKELIKTALQNLLDNAAKYSLPDTEIQVHITDRTVTVANKAEPLTKDELKQLTQPFVRRDKSRHQHGNGLGLSIIKSIADLHGAKFDMTMKEDTVVCRFAISNS